MESDGGKKHTFSKIFSWFWGIYLILGGTTCYNKIPIGIAIIAIIFGIAILPPIDKNIKEKMLESSSKFSEKKYKYIKIILGFIILIVFSESVQDETENIQNTTNIPIESSISENETTATSESKSNAQENVTLNEKNGTYTGDVTDNKKNDSNGKFEFQNGYVYEGNFSNNQIDGQGKLTVPNIGTYEGKFSKGKRSGYGKMNFTNGDVYEGNWENDEMSGTGKYTFANGDKYEGNFSKNMFNGNGTYTFKSTGKAYTGTWENNSYKG